MITSTSFFFSWFVVLAFAGAGLYVWDRGTGVKVYRWFYDMTHKSPLAADVQRGFIFHRTSQSRFTLAVVIAVVQSGFALAFEASTVAQELLSVIIEAPCLMLGFAFGPVLYRLWVRRDDMFETVDQIESGELSLSEKVKEMSQKALSKVTDAVIPDEPAPPAPAAAAKPPEEEIDPKKFMSRYLNRE